MDKELIKALSDPSFYGEAASGVELAQTHISFLFFTDKHVYKVKKAVNFDFLDFSTLELRRHYCLREVELNRRLCPDIYLGVVEIRRSGNGFALSGEGEVVEYAVKMSKMPRGLMMDSMLARGMVGAPEIERVARRLHEFHSACLSDEEISSYGELRWIRKNIEENFLQTVRFIGSTLSAPRYAYIEKAARDFMIENKALFSERVKTGRIKDCHGDLRLEHICLADGIYIFDCVEFNDRFRYGDVASEAAFLAMDLDRAGVLELSRAFVNSYASLSRDANLKRLANFYKCYRAYIRGKVESFKIDDHDIGAGERERSLLEARGYFDLAFSYAMSVGRPMLMITCGLMGAGKTAAAEEMARRLKIRMISTDGLRKAAGGIARDEPVIEEYGKGFYAEPERYKIYERMLDLASAHLAEGDSVILDGSFSKACLRREALERAKRFGADFVVLHFACSDATALSRLKSRRAEGHLLSDGRQELYYRQKADFQEPNEIDRQKRITIDSEAGVVNCAEEALDAMACEG